MLPLMLCVCEQAIYYLLLAVLIGRKMFGLETLSPCKGATKLRTESLCWLQTILCMRVAISNPVITKSFVACQLEDNSFVAGEEPPEMWLAVAVSTLAFLLSSAACTTDFCRHPNCYRPPVHHAFLFITDMKRTCKL